MADRGAVSGVDLRTDADCVLSELPARPSAGNGGFRFPALLVAHVHGRAVAFRPGVVSLGAAGARRDRRGGLVGCAPTDREARPPDLCRAHPADDGLRDVSDGLDRSLFSDAPGVRRRGLAGMGEVPVSDPDQPHPALCRIFPCRRRGRRGRPEGRAVRHKRRTRATLAGLARLCAGVLCRDPCCRLRPPQLGCEFRFAAAALETGLWPGFCGLQCRDGVRGNGDIRSLRRYRLGPARCAAAFGLRHLSRALHFHHLAAIRAV